MIQTKCKRFYSFLGPYIHSCGVTIPYTTLADAGCLSLFLSLHEQPATPLFVFRSRLSVADNPSSDTPTLQPGYLRCIQLALDTGALFLRLQVECASWAASP